MALEGEIKDINDLIEAYTAHSQPEYLDNLKKQEEILSRDPGALFRGKCMLYIKEDTDVSPVEKDYLISKGWDLELFETYHIPMSQCS